jgi:hypothetical protein
MLNIKPVLIGKSLENERDFWFQNMGNEELYMQVLKTELNIFFFIYILSITDETGVATNMDTLSLYRKFYSTKFNSVRFLLELLLLSTEILSQKTEQDKNIFVLSLALSEKINGYSINRDILTLDPSNKAYIETLAKDRREYSAFISKYGKISPLIPDEIDTFFPNKEPNLLSNRKSPEFFTKFGFRFHKNNKVNYSNIINKNQKLETLIKQLKGAGILSPTIDNIFLRNMYSLLSEISHPTFSAIQLFENFISQNPSERAKTCLNDQDVNDALLKVIGVLMDALYKDFRGEKSLNKNIYSNPTA